MIFNSKMEKENNKNEETDTNAENCDKEEQNEKKEKEKERSILSLEGGKTPLSLYTRRVIDTSKIKIILKRIQPMVYVVGKI